MDWLYKISITCFAASYIVVLGLEVSRIFFAARLRHYVRVGFAAAGLFAHSVYLLWQGKLELDSSGIWLNSWFGWCLAAAWVLAAAYLWIALRQPRSIIGMFLLPVTLLLIGCGFLFGAEDEFATGRAKTIWGMVHGISLSLGTAVITLGFVFGVVYLIQAKRLKQKLPPPKLFRLPSLEWLQQSSERSLIISTILLALGLLSGIAMNLAKNPMGGLGSDVAQLTSKIAWSDPVIWSSGILFTWLVLVTIFNKFYQPARQGRKVAYLVVTSFLFLILELGIVLWSGHAVAPNASVDYKPDAQASESFTAEVRQ